MRMARILLASGSSVAVALAKVNRLIGLDSEYCGRTVEIVRINHITEDFLPRIARIARIGWETCPCLSVPSVKSVVHFLTPMDYR